MFCFNQSLMDLGSSVFAAQMIFFSLVNKIKYYFATQIGLILLTVLMSVWNLIEREDASNPPDKDRVAKYLVLAENCYFFFIGRIVIFTCYTISCISFYFEKEEERRSNHLSAGSIENIDEANYKKILVSSIGE